MQYNQQGFIVIASTFNLQKDNMFKVFHSFDVKNMFVSFNKNQKQNDKFIPLALIKCQKPEQFCNYLYCHIKSKYEKKNGFFQLSLQNMKTMILQIYNIWKCQYILANLVKQYSLQSVRHTLHNMLILQKKTIIYNNSQIVLN